MSWHYSPGLVAGCWEPDSSAGEPSAPSNGTSTAAPSSSKGKKKPISIRSRCGTTFVPLTDARGVAAWMSSLAAFPASPSASPASERPTTTNATDGPTPLGSLAKYDPDSHSWKTSQVSLLTGTSEPFSETWPRWGTMRNGVCWERTTPAPLTSATDSGFLPTATKYDSTPGGPNNHYHGLGWMAKQGKFPTPTAEDAEQTGFSPDRGHTLTSLARDMAWPTPSVAAATGGQTSRGGKRKGEKLLAGMARERDGWPTPHGMAATAKRRPGPSGNELGHAVNRRAWPTPTKQDAENTAGPSQFNRNSLPLNTAVVSPGGMLTQPTIQCGCGCVFLGELDTPCPTCKTIRDATVTLPPGMPMPWGTPRNSDGMKAAVKPGRKNRGRLEDQVANKTYRTPTNRDHHPNTAIGKPPREGRSVFLANQIAEQAPGGALNPDWVEWLMGWPVGWTDLQPLATVRFQRWFVSHTGL